MKMYSPYGPLYPVPVANPIKVRLNRIIIFANINQRSIHQNN